MVIANALLPHSLRFIAYAEPQLGRPPPFDPQHRLQSGNPVKGNDRMPAKLLTSSPPHSRNLGATKARRPEGPSTARWGQQTVAHFNRASANLHMRERRFIGVSVPEGAVHSSTASEPLVVHHGGRTGGVVSSDGRGMPRRAARKSTR